MLGNEGGFLCTHYRQSANLANVGYIRDVVICLRGRHNQDNEFKCWTYLIQEANATKKCQITEMNDEILKVVQKF